MLRDDLPATRVQPRQISIDISFGTLLKGVLVAGGLWLLVQIWSIVVLIVIALILVGTLTPLVDRLEQRRLPRGAALTLVASLLIFAILGLGFLVVPALVNQSVDLLNRLPELRQQLAATIEPYPFLRPYLAAYLEGDHDQQIEAITGAALAFAPVMIEFVTLAVTTVILAFYTIADRERVLGFTYALIPRAYHVRTARMVLDMGTIVGGYVRGQALTSLLIFLFTFLLLQGLRAPNALAIAVFAAFVNLIPFVGTLLATIPVLLVVLPQGLTPTLIALTACIIYEEFEARWLVPRVYGQTMRLSPVAVTVALLVGGKLLGIVGALLALPVAAALRVLVQHLRIDLPGEQPTEPTQRALDAHAEARYTAEAGASPAVESAAVALQVAEEMQVLEDVAAAEPDHPLVGAVVAEAAANGVVPPADAVPRPRVDGA